MLTWWVGLNAVEEEAEENCSVASGVLEYGTYIGAGTYVMAVMAQAQHGKLTSKSNLLTKDSQRSGPHQLLAPASSAKGWRVGPTA